MNLTKVREVYNIIGVMSGTSLDGIDIAHITFTFSKKWNFDLKNFKTFSYPLSWKKKLKNSINIKPNELNSLDKLYTEFLATKINLFIKKYNIKKLDAVSSHGHTVFHKPEHGITVQIGNLAELSNLINQKVVVNFREQDVKLGGQGAPLVPIGDKLLFSEYKYFLNLGGFANLSLKDNKNFIAYDICAVNTVLNNLSLKLGRDYDFDGNFAKKGNIIVELLNELNKIDFYKKSSPKSLAVEWNKKFIWPLINKYKSYSINDLLRTYVEHISIHISKAFKKKQKVLVTGGGAFNKFLISKIKNKSLAKFVIPKPEIINYKEAIIFGFLGVLKLRNEINCLSSITGAKKDHSSGVIFELKK